MADKQMTLAVILRGLDYLSGPLRRAAAGIKDVDTEAKRAKSLGLLSNDLKGFGDGLQRIGMISTGMGAGLGVALGLHQLPGEAVAAEHSLRAIANTADLSESQIREMQLRVRALSKETNQTQAQLIAGLAVLTASGMGLNDAMKALPGIGKTATAATAEVSDIANAAFAVITHLKVEASTMPNVLDWLASAGKAGQFELRDMAQYFSTITATAGSLGIVGPRAVLSLAAALQIARKGAGTSAEAATNFGAFLSQIASPEVQANFKKLGVNVKRELEQALAQGEDPILRLVKVTQRVTKGDMFRLGEVFNNIRVQEFLRPMMASLEEYERIKRESMKGGAVNRDYERIMRSVTEQRKELRINIAALVGSKLDGGLGFVNRTLTAINDNPGLQKLLVGTSVGLLGFGAATIGVGLAVKAVGVWISVVSKGRLAAAAFKAGWLGAAKGLEGGSWLVAKAGSAAHWSALKVGAGLSWLRAGAVRALLPLRALTVATWAWTGALLANPLTWVVVGIVALTAATYLIVRHWSSIAAFFSGVWRGIRGAFSAGLNWIRRIDFFGAGANIVRQIWAGMKSLASKPIEVVMSIVQKIRDHLPFSPAKLGPLRDLHRVRIIETIAGSMNPGPMVAAMRAAAALSFAAISPANAGVHSPRSAAALTPAAAVASVTRGHVETITRRSASTDTTAAPMQFTYAPVVHLPPGTPRENERAVRQALAQDRAGVQRMVERAMQEYKDNEMRKRFRRD